MLYREGMVRRCRILIGAAVVIWISACGGDITTGPTVTVGPDTPEVDVPKNEFCNIPEEFIFWGGVQRDGIPSLVDPALVEPDAPDADYLRDFDRVIGIEVGGSFVAVPHNILWWHEIVNFNGLGVPLAVSYCPLTGSSMVFDRRTVMGVDFGVSGLLFNNNLIMFNRREDGSPESLFPQMARGARCGPLQGAPLPMYPAVEMRWDAWKELHPETRVVSGDLGFARDYQLYPYGNYEVLDNAETLFLNPEFDDRRLPKERVLGIPRSGGLGMAFPFAALESMGDLAVVHDDVQGTRSVVVFWSAAARAAVAFRPIVDGESFTFEVRDQGYYDVETGSEWSVSGIATAGPMAGTVLEPIDDAYVAFWFAWATFHPGTGLFEPASVGQESN